MTLQEFIDSYEGFDWNESEIVVINQRTGYNKLGTLKSIMMYESFEKCLSFTVHHWTHTDKTMLIIL